MLLNPGRNKLIPLLLSVKHFCLSTFHITSWLSFRSVGMRQAIAIQSLNQAIWLVRILLLHPVGFCKEKWKYFVKGFSAWPYTFLLKRNIGKVSLVPKLSRAGDNIKSFWYYRSRDRNLKGMPNSPFKFLKEIYCVHL